MKHYWKCLAASIFLLSRAWGPQPVGLNRRVHPRDDTAVVPYKSRNNFVTLVSGADGPHKGQDIGLDQSLRLHFANFNGIICVVSPQDGEILGEFIAPPLTNRDKFPPGSLIKVFTTLAGLQTDPTLKEFLAYCSPSSPGTPVYKACWWRQGHGQLDLVQALAYSCDRYFMQLSRKVDFYRFLSIIQEFELLTFAEIEGLKKLGRLEKNKIMVGLSEKLKVSPYEIFSVFCALYNGGYIFDLQGKGNLIKKVELDSKILKIIQQGMRESSVYGTSLKAQDEVGLRKLASKTGTATYVCNNRVDYKKTHGWYIGFYPENKPEVGVLVFVMQGTGSKEAATIGGKVFSLYFNTHRE